MTKTISLTTAKVHRISIDYDNQFAEVIVDFLDASGRAWDRKVCTFWVTMPPPPPYSNGVIPDEWFLLGSTYLPTLIQLQTDAQAAVAAKFLV
jgi:hypothetical protein